MYLSTRQSQLSVALLVALSIMSIVFTHALLSLNIWTFHVAIPHNSPPNPAGLRTYTLQGEDVPKVLPIELSGPVQMTVEESIHYSITDAEAEQEWLYTSPYGTGLVRLGDQYRPFVVSMFHQLHCLRTFRSRLADSRAAPDVAHVHHCLNYMRQATLCQADLTLEKGDFAEKHSESEREGATHTCRNWDDVYNEMRVNWVDWYRHRKGLNVTAGYHVAKAL